MKKTVRSGVSLQRAADLLSSQPYTAGHAARMAAPTTTGQRKALRALGYQGEVPATVGETGALISQLKREQGVPSRTLLPPVTGLALGIALLSLPAPARAQSAFSSLVLVGDSITRGHGTSGTGQSAPILYSLAAGLGIDPGEITNLGVNGRTTSDWLNGPIEAAVSAASPHSLFLVMLGTNDARIGPTGRSVGEWLFHAKLIVERIHAGGHEVVWNAAPFIAAGAAGWPASSGDRVALYNARIVDTGAIVGDTTSWDWFRDRPARLPDGVHPDDTGAIALGQMWACAAQQTYGIVLPESGAGMFVVVFLAFLAGHFAARAGWRWPRK